MEMQPELIDLTGPAKPVGFSVRAADLPQESGDEATYGTVTWRTMICGDRTGSHGLVMGMAEFGPFGTLLPHRHTQPEFYLGLGGDGVVTIEGVPHPIGPGIAVYVPGDAEHGVVAGQGGLSFAYGFATDRFGDVTYRFSAQSL